MADPIYATVEELIAYSGSISITEEEAERKLARASRLIDSVLIGAVYPTDPTTHIATGEDIRNAIKNATMAEAAYWIYGAGSEHGAAMYDSVSIGSVTLGGAGKGNERGTILAPQAFYELNTAPGLFPITARIRG